MYLVSTTANGKRHGCIVTSFAQVTSSYPPRFTITLNKDNATTDAILASGVFSVTLLGTECSDEVINTFGYKSGRVGDKFNGFETKTDEAGCPYLTDHMELFRACVVREQNQEVSYSVENIYPDFLSKGNVVIQTAYSSVNYKDHLAVKAKGGVIRNYPMIPGIDVSGTVVSSNTDAFQVGQEVLVTGFEMGMTGGNVISTSDESSSCAISAGGKTVITGGTVTAESGNQVVLSNAVVVYQRGLLSKISSGSLSASVAVSPSKTYAVPTETDGLTATGYSVLADHGLSIMRSSAYRNNWSAVQRRLCPF